MELICQVLGSGTSTGVPMPGCSCPVCASVDPFDQRLRASILLQWDGINCLIDTTTDLRQQALRTQMQRLDAVLITHNHADHVSGLDDVRPFCFKRPPDHPIPVFGHEIHLRWLRKRYDYIWEAKQIGGGLPNIELRPVREPFTVFGQMVVPLPAWHGELEVFGYRIGPLAYLSDVSRIPQETYHLLEGVHCLFLDGLRYRPHLTHFNITQAVEAAQRIGAAQTWLTHICHDCRHADLVRELPAGIAPAYDGLRLTLEL